ncbi:phosphate signaling complex protein PhoU [Pararhodobacter oceanensis]|uniref:Phosphate-specific transport system accessory protein PhoU n=1 Tax=Pararhodobacter oceanensis TaxID=2172121 RepID=A0A2T8HWY0_9RHOB|nr:phosphate signaling complex protein PhoU [Pararhodobacter oceanensis]PVH29862.1 phosphate transport system regulatory protein PhoU [Pararhodobacter oceanensis]
MDTKHISSAFDRDLQGAQAMLMTMAAQVETAMLRAAEALATNNLEMAETVRKNDRAIDELEEGIKIDCARILATRSPNAGDLRTVLTVMSIASNLERCGDYAKNIAKRTSVLADAHPVKDVSPALRRMQKAVVAMMGDALDAYTRRDLEIAQEVRERDREVDELYNTLFRSLLTHMMEEPQSITACMHLHFIAKNIERMGDHTTSVAEQVIYLVTGELPDEDRPKGDLTSLSSPESFGDPA